MATPIVLINNLLQGLVSGLDCGIRALLAVGMGVIMSAIIFHVVGRYFFGWTYMGTMELVRYTMIWVSILGAAAAFTSKEHVVINMLSKKLPERVWFWCRIGGDLILCGFFVAMIYGGQSLAIRNFNQTSLGLQIPMFYPYLAIPVGGGLMLLYSLADLLNILVDRCGFQAAASEVDR
jgi:TRAP-type C4-dicarboxylate transport system permease small subunit